jgi:integrase
MREKESLADPYSMFVYAIKSPLTMRKYQGNLTRFFEFIDIGGDTINAQCTSFEQKGRADPEWATLVIIKFLQSLKRRVECKEISGATVRNYIKAIRLFCEMSEILIPWKKIMRGLPRSRTYANDRAPTLEEIKRITNYPDRRIKPIVYFMASSGIRLGAWDHLKWGHIKPIERNGKIVAARVRVYAGDDDEYTSFITPEAYFEIEGWINYRKECGESVTDESWVMRNLWEVTSPKDPAALTNRGLATIPQKLHSSGIKRLMERSQWAQGVRKKLENGRKRHEFQADHGFRKWFKTRCELSGIKSITIEKLMGHSIGISDSYLRATEAELLEQYLEAVDFLTIEEKYKLEKQVTQLAEESKEENYIIKGQLVEKEEQIKHLSDKFDNLQSMVEKMISSLASDSNQQNLNTIARTMHMSGILKPSQEQTNL